MRSVSFRVGDATYDRMRQAAERDNRTLSNWIETILLRHLDELDRQQQRGERERGDRA
jgi:hypothetical protein